MIRVALAVLGCLAAADVARAGSLLIAAPYNVFTLGNFTQYAGSVQGGVAGGGTVTVSNISIGTSFAPQAAFYTLVAGHDLVAISGSVNGSVFDPVPGGISQAFTTPGGVDSGAGGPIDFANASKELKALSSGLGDMPTTTGDSCAPYYYYLECTATQHGLNVINITNTSYLANGHAPSIRALYSDAVVVLNIAASNVSLTGGGWLFDGISPQRVLLNFYGTSSLTLNGSVPVSVLAPNAAVTASSGTLSGNLVADSFTGQYSFDNTLFTGDLPSFAAATPEPVTLALVGTALAALIGVRRRR